MRFHALLFVVVFSAVAVSAQEPTTRIRAATVIDGTGKVLRNATIVVQGSKITSIDTGVSGSASYKLGQLTVLPGMIDVHGSGCMNASVHAGCQRIEHGVLAGDEVLKLVADKGVCLGPNIGVVLQNYLKNMAKFLGVGNSTEEGFAYIEKGLALNKAM